MKQSWKPCDGCSGHLEAIDMRGNMPGTLRLHTEHARKELLEFVGRQHADKIMMDGPDGAQHVGYVIGPHWFIIVLVLPAERA